VEVRSNGRPRSLEGQNLVVAVGSRPMIPPIEGLEEAGYWTSNVGTSLRDLPSSMVVLGGGAVGVELAQVYGRFGVETVLVESHPRILPRDHPKSSEAVQDQLREEGVDLRLGVQAELVSKGGRGRRVKLSDGSVVEGAEVLVAVGRRPMDLREMGIEEAGVKVDDHGVASPDDQMRASARVFVAGDAAGGMQFTHVADYQGRIAAKAALGKPARADLRSVPRATYTYPETGAVGFTVEEAQEQGIDAFEVTQDFTTTARGYSIEGSRGHVTAVVDRERKTLAGVFAACPAASELFHEGVLAIKLSIPVEVLADTLHAFPTGARVFGNLMTEALKRL
ncbi:MAG: FAD-dependent oxidoreductase, partial [Actinomycetota bacterium]